MSRSGYSDDYDCDIDQWAMIRWRGAVKSALRGRRGQAFLLEAVAALDALPAPELARNNLVANGAFCTLGSVGLARSLDVSKVDPEDHELVAKTFAIPHSLACEIMYENDEGTWGLETPGSRWLRMRAWLSSLIKDDTK